MAISRDEALILLQGGPNGVAEWNTRRHGVETLPRLCGADLGGARLNGANLGGIDLRESALQGASLAMACLEGADLGDAYLAQACLYAASLGGARLRGAVLAGADLSRSDLRCVDLSRAVLTDVDIRDAELVDAVLEDTDLRATNLKGVRIERAGLVDTHLELAVMDASTRLFGVDLRRTRGLDETIGAPTVDYETLRLSEGAASDDFLRRCRISAGALEGRDSVTLTFRRDVWADLLPIELVLRRALGPDYVIRKGPDRIDVILRSPGLLQVALDALSPILASLHRAEPGELVKLGVTPTEGAPESVQGDRLRAQLDYLVARFDEVHPPDERELALVEETTAKGLSVIPLAGPVLELWFTRWRESRASAGHRRVFEGLSSLLSGQRELRALEDSSSGTTTSATQGD